MTRSRDVADVQDNLGGAVPPFAAGKNKIINGDFRINQRNFTSTVNNGYTFDRWTKSTSGSTGTVSPQVFTPGAAPVAGYEGTNFLRLVTAGQSAAGDSAQISQFIEDVRTFAGQTITISFWAKANTGTPKVYVETYQIFGAGGSSAVIQTGTQITLSTSWARYSVTITVPSISGKTIGTSSYLQIWFNMGLNETTTFDVWGTQAEASPTASEFQTATGTLQGELAACQRYFEILDTTNQNDWIGDFYNTTNCYAPIFWKVTKRVAPTLTLPSAASFIVWNAGASLTPSVVGTDTLVTNGGTIYGTTSVRTVGTAGRFRLSSNTVSVSAEL